MSSRNLRAVCFLMLWQTADIFLHLETIRPNRRGFAKPLPVSPFTFCELFCVMGICFCVVFRKGKDIFSCFREHLPNICGKCFADQSPFVVHVGYVISTSLNFKPFLETGTFLITAPSFLM